MNQEEKVLTYEIVHHLKLDRLEVITSDMLDGYTRIENWAFYKCNSLISVIIPNSVTSIGDFAFYKCDSLISIIIPDSVTSIGCQTFYGCSALTSITIPNSIINIGNNAFGKCTSLPIINNLRYADTYLVEVVDKSLSTYSIKNGTKWIGDYSFENCSLLTSIILPNSVINIGNHAFENCTSLTSIILPDSIINIGNYAFWNCSSFTSITIPNNLNKIGFFVFGRCLKLNSIIIGTKSYKSKKVINGNCKAYKAFKVNLTCRGFQYEEGNTYNIDGEPKLCKYGFHACLNIKDVFNYYNGEVGKDVVVYEVEIEGISDETSKNDSKVVAKKITIGKRIL